MLKQQLSDLTAGIPPSNRVSIKQMERSLQVRLREAFSRIDGMASIVRDGLLEAGRDRGNL